MKKPISFVIIGAFCLANTISIFADETSTGNLLITPAPTETTTQDTFKARIPVTLEATLLKNKKEKVIDFHDNLMKITVKYPTGIQKDADMQIEQYINTALMAFQEWVPEKLFSPNWKNEMVITYRLRNIGTYASVEFTVYEFTGGAHGNTSLKTFNFDRKTGKDLTLTEIFPQKDALKQIAKISEKTFTKLLKAKKLGSDLNWVKEGTRPVVENYSNFVITQAQKVGKKTVFTIKFLFPQYQISCYADGIQSLFINSTNLK